MPARLSDEYIIKMVLEGSPDAFEMLVHRYQSAVLGFTYYLTHNFADAEDLTQETFIQAFLSLHQLNNPDKFASWLRQITANIYRMWLRQRQRGRFVSVEKVPDSEFACIPSPKNNPDKQIEDMETRDALQKSYESLSDECRLVITLRYIDGLTYKDIGDFLDIPISTVKWRLYDARRRLKKEILEMIGKDLKQQNEEFQKKMLRKVMEGKMKILEQVHNRISSTDKGHLYFQKRRINQPGDPQWVRVIWDDFIKPEEFMVANQQVLMST